MSDRSSGRVESRDVFGLLPGHVWQHFGNDSLCLWETNPMNRSYFHADRVARLAGELSERELAILSTLERVRLATGRQIETLHFDTNTSRHRRRVLQSLTDLRLVARLDRRIGGRRAGSAGHLFALDIGGQHLLARVTNREVRRPTTPGSRFILHVLAVTEIYVGLVLAERRGLIELQAFEAEPSSWRRFAGPGGGLAVAKPDAYVRLGVGGFLDSWFLEIDRATESASTLARKADIYRAYYASGVEQKRHGVFPRVLWCVPHERRYQVVVDVCSRQPADAWALHQVTLTSDAVGLMSGATP